MKSSLFGTDGIRGRVGEGLFVSETLMRIGFAIGRWATVRYGPRPVLLIVSDTRASASWIKAALTTGLLQTPVDIIDGGVVPTPGAAHLLRADRCAHAALVISASHNPAEDNGIKILDAITGKLSATDEQLVTAYFYDDCRVQGTTFGSVSMMHDAIQRYRDLIVAQLPGPWAVGLRVVLDTAYGATSQIAASCFTSLGAEVIMLHDTPDGYNINKKCGSTDVLTLQAAVFAQSADVGFAFDGDGDRVIVVNRWGVVKDGDDILALLLSHPAYQHTPAVVGTIMSNAGLQHYCHERGIGFLRTAVGDKHIAEALERENWLLGGEPSGHIIMRNHLMMGDGLMVARWILSTMVLTGNSDLVTFTKYPQITCNIPVARRYDLSHEYFMACIHEAEQLVGPGRIAVRYSGTEPVLRVMVEACDMQRAEEISHKLVFALQKAFERSSHVS